MEEEIYSFAWTVYLEKDARLYDENNHNSLFKLFFSGMPIKAIDPFGLRSVSYSRPGVFSYEVK